MSPWLLSSTKEVALEETGASSLLYFYSVHVAEFKLCRRDKVEREGTYFKFFFYQYIRAIGNPENDRLSHIDLMER